MSLKRQRGAALFIAMLLLILLTSLGVMVMTETDMDLKMTGAAVSRELAEQRLEGAASELLTSVVAQENFIQLDKGDTGTASSTVYDTVSISLEGRGDFGCRRSFAATSTDLMDCRFVQVDMADSYGKGRTGQVGLGLGVEQPFLSQVSK